jgi:hypothetical protein
MRNFHVCSNEDPKGKTQKYYKLGKISGNINNRVAEHCTMSLKR